MTGLIFQNQFENLKPSPPTKKTKETTCHLQKIRTISKWKFVHLLNPGPHGKIPGFLLLSMPQAQVSKFSKDHLLEYSCNAGSIKCNLSWKGIVSRNFGENPMLFCKKSERRKIKRFGLEMQYSKCVARGFHTVLSMKKKC